MLKKTFLVLSLITTIRSISQDAISIGVTGEYSENLNLRNYSGGFQVEIPLGDKFTLNYKALIGGSSDGALYTHAPVGAAFGVILMRYLGSPTSSKINAFGVLLMAIPEGVAFYPNPEGKLRAGIYLSPLGCDYWYKKSNYEYFRFSGEIGGRLKIPLGKDGDADIFLQGGIKYLYRNKFIEPLFFNAGAGISFNLN